MSKFKGNYKGRQNTKINENPEAFLFQASPPLQSKLSNN
jgi:hypothetical protein